MFQMFYILIMLCTGGIQSYKLVSLISMVISMSSVVCHRYYSKFLICNITHIIDHSMYYFSSLWKGIFSFRD